MWISANRFAYRDELRNVESPLAEFEFRHECLALTDALAQFCRMRCPGSTFRVAA